MREITGRKLRILRNKLDMTHEEFSSFIGTCKTSVSRWEAYNNRNVYIQKKYKQKIIVLLQNNGIFR